MNLSAALNTLAREPEAPFDVAELALHLARDEYPDLDVEAYLGVVDGLAHEARRFARGDLSARVAGLCRYLFHEMGFRGNARDYYDPHNSYLNDVLERRTGIPISLSLVTMAVGARIGLPMVGVGLPGHFIVKVQESGQEILLDPFHGGRQLTATDCENLVQQVTGHGFTASAAALRPLPLGLIVQRMLMNLKAIYQAVGDWQRAIRVMERLRVVNPRDAAQQRDLGAAWLQAGQPGKAISFLERYLRTEPAVDDADAVAKLLRQARQQIAAWN